MTGAIGDDPTHLVDRAAQVDQHLSGRVRLILGDRDLILERGDVAEFETRVPHWFGSTGDGPAEVLSIFGRPGERMLARTKNPGSLVG